MFRKWICKIFKLVPKEDYDELENEFDNNVKIFIEQAKENNHLKEKITELKRENLVLSVENTNLTRENTELKRTLEKCYTTPHEFVGISYSSLFPKNCTEEMLRESAWNKICDKVKNNGVQYDFRDGECVATLSVLK